ncbi:carbohydrate esterase [Dichotomopilus funicola]|uniref:Carbohydrate esterase n=1 Tax=Dichotomopilus funicola TaxID=1934379 RepID=A0AAN6ZKK5_9PEZI|nr:carbohydrate esterase [Dichotomopilus funicola]
MVIGDSISHGREGDWTWRYRIWQWLVRDEGLPNVRFVGPYKGTVPPDEAHPPRPPRCPDDPAELPAPLRTDGGYAAGAEADFLDNSDHFAASGQQVCQAKDLVKAQVAVYQPDVCLVQLGFNDLGWRMCGPLVALTDMKCLVDEVRAAKPDVKLAIADIPQRTDLPGREDLPVDTRVYNSMLAQVIPYWSTPKSPIALVRFCDNYSCGGSKSDAAYDGLHPNALGDYELAQAFSRTLVSAFSIGRSSLVIPKHIPPRPLSTPAGLKAISTPGGIVVKWEPVYGALGYCLQRRLAGERDWTTNELNCTTYYWPPQRKGEVIECRVRSNGGDSVHSPWSDIASAVAKPETASPPSNIITHATADGFAISWDTPRRPYAGEIDRYGILYFDGDQPGAFPSLVGARGNKTKLTGLVPGHRYFINMSTWTTAGEGRYASAHAVIVGKGKPQTPTPVRAKALDAQNLELSCPEVDGAAGYSIWIRGHGHLELRVPPKKTAETTPARQEKGSSLEPSMVTIAIWASPSIWDYEYAISAYNGDDESDQSNWVFPPRLDSVDVSLTQGDAIHVQVRYG